MEEMAFLPVFTYTVFFVDMAGADLAFFQGGGV